MPTSSVKLTRDLPALALEDIGMTRVNLP
jgi:hypothetical protein